MLEKVLPWAKYLFFNFDNYLIVGLVLLLIIIKYKPNLLISKKVIALGNYLYQIFVKISETKTFRLLLIFFIINFIIRLIMAIPVPAIALDKIAPHYLDLARSMYRGQGFTIAVIWNNFLQDQTIIRPDFFRVPFYPLLITLSYKIFGFNFLAAKLVNVIAGSLLPILAFLLGLILTKSKKIATLLLIFISFNGLIISWVAFTYPEIVYCCLIILLLYLLYQTSTKINSHSFLVGVILALTYLTRTEGLLILLPVILFFYFYQQDKKLFFRKLFLTFIGFLIVASPYLARNYIITKNPFYSDFDKIAMAAYVGHDRLIESPNAEYKDIYDLAWHNPYKTAEMAITKIIDGIKFTPQLLIGSYLITLLTLIGIFYVCKTERKKYYFIFILILTGFLVPVLAIGFEDRYHIELIIIFYLLAALGILQLYEVKFKDDLAFKSILMIYLFLFITLNFLGGVIKGSFALVPHNFYQRFDEKGYFSGLEDFYSYVKNNTESTDVVMTSRRPYEVNYFTDRPTVTFPYADADGVQEYIKKYQVKWIIWMGTPQKENDKYYRFWLPQEIPDNIKPVFKNTGADLFEVEYYK
ncbi:MAG: glycosyltransferase family 39 protein [Patescibacteria group bacterium]